MNSDAIIEINDQKATQIVNKTTSSVEFFHIYTDEKINGVHQASVDIMRQTRQLSKQPPTTVVLIDNYNPTEHILSPEAVFEYLSGQGELPDYWAYEADMIENAQTLLQHLTSKLRNEYERYIAKSGKYPCSLLTASWYLARLGYLDPAKVIKRIGAETEYTPVSKIMNILPDSYRSIETRTFDVIKHSSFAHALDAIEDIFYQSAPRKNVKLF